MNRLEMLLRYFGDDPNDPFNIYALAIEYLKSDQQKSKELFEKLLRDHPQYVPTYYHAAKLYQELNDKDKAIATYERGMVIALKSGELKAHRELRSAYDELMLE
jgi:tetratricopeptide (TPR) repeat protein